MKYYIHIFCPCQEGMKGSIFLVLRERVCQGILLAGVKSAVAFKMESKKQREKGEWGIRKRYRSSTYFFTLFFCPLLIHFPFLLNSSTLKQEKWKFLPPYVKGNIRMFKWDMQPDFFILANWMILTTSLHLLKQSIMHVPLKNHFLL